MFDKAGWKVLRFVRHTSYHKLISRNLFTNSCCCVAGFCFLVVYLEVVGFECHLNSLVSNLVSLPTYEKFTYFVVSILIFSEVSCSCVIRCKGLGGYKLLCRISATTWISLSFSAFASGYYCIPCKKNLTDEYLCAGGRHEWSCQQSQIFLYMLNNNESVCLVIVMFRKFILFFLL